MMRAMFAAISGMATNQTMLDVAANDLANVNTIGFKGSRATFKDSLSQLTAGGTAAAGTSSGSNPEQVGLGVSLGSIDSQMSGGAVQSTGNPLDVSVQGDGWFRLGTGSPTPGNPVAGVPTGQLLSYTRAGNFSRNDAGYLTESGSYVLGRTQAGGGQDCFINIPSGATDVSIGEDGSVSFLPPTGFTQPASLPPIDATGRAIAGYIALSKFPNENGLQRASGNRWTANQASGVETVNTPGQGGGTFGSTVAGTLEMSNVDLATEFTNLITAQRAYQANTKVVSTGDEMLQDLVNLKH